jgi:hypothetical protein
MKTEPKLIGFASWQGPIVAQLWGHNRWTVKVNGKEDTTRARNLKALYTDRLVYGGPGDGFYGYAVLEDLAQQMGGRFTFYPPDTPQGVKY